MNDFEMIKNYFNKLGIEDDASIIYLELHRQGGSSALGLSKATSISRTQVYRMIDILKEYSLVSAESIGYGTIFRPLPVENLDHYLSLRAAETDTIKRQLPNISFFLKSLASKDLEPSIRHYYGKSGVKQVTWNITKAKEKFCVFEVSHVSSFTDKIFSKRFREEVIRKNLKGYDLTNDTSVNLKEIQPVNLNNVEVRHVDKSVLDIQFEVILYNDTVALLDYKSSKPVAIEVVHPALKTMMQQLFDSIWNTSSPIKIPEA